MTYVAFLRGINLGNRRVKMEDLQQIFMDAGMSDVKTLIASGNVIFSTNEKDEIKLQKLLEEKLQKRFGFFILVISRNMTEIKNLVDKNPFDKITSSQTSRNDDSKQRQYITFFAEDIKSTESVKKDDYEISVIDNKTLASIVYPEGKSTDMMTFIEKTYGKNSTTRNWNTILKLLTVDL